MSDSDLFIYQKNKDSDSVNIGFFKASDFFLNLWWFLTDENGSDATLFISTTGPIAATTIATGCAWLSKWI